MQLCPVYLAHNYLISRCTVFPSSLAITANLTLSHIILSLYAILFRLVFTQAMQYRSILRAGGVNNSFFTKNNRKTCFLRKSFQAFLHSCRLLGQENIYTTTPVHVYSCCPSPEWFFMARITFRKKVFYFQISVFYRAVLLYTGTPPWKRLHKNENTACLFTDIFGIYFLYIPS